jgi:hypothetical protein
LVVVEVTDTSDASSVIQISVCSSFCLSVCLSVCLYVPSCAYIGIRCHAKQEQFLCTTNKMDPYSYGIFEHERKKKEKKIFWKSLNLI